MGDVAMTVPVLRALVLQYPEVKITVVSRPFFQPFFDGIPNVNFFGVDLKERHKGFVGLLRLFSDLRKLNIDAVADLHNVLRSKVVRTLFALSGKKIAATDKGRAEKKALTSLTNKVFAPVKPMVERHVDTFKQLGFAIDLSNPQFPEKAILSEEVLSITGTKNQNWIGIAPFAQYESKVYPLDLMQQVIDGLAEKITQLLQESQIAIQSSRDNIEKLTQVTTHSISGMNDGAEKMRLAVKSLSIEHKLSEKNIDSISLGVASAIPSHNKEISKLIKAADIALYESKENGRDMVSIKEYED